MKRRRRELQPKRLAGAFPQYLYESLDELEGPWPEQQSYETALIERCHQLHRKALFILENAELELAIRQKIGLRWILPLALIRLRQDPLAAGEFSNGDLLRACLLLPRTLWGNLIDEFELLVDSILPLIEQPEDDNWLDEWVIKPYLDFKASR